MIGNSTKLIVRISIENNITDGKIKKDLITALRGKSIIESINILTEKIQNLYMERTELEFLLSPPVSAERMQHGNSN